MVDTQNRILRALPERTRAVVLQSCERVTVERQTTLDRAGDMATTVHFPETAVISTLATYQDGTSMEMANIGRDACTGVGLILGNPRHLSTNEVQVGGDILDMPAEKLISLRDGLPGFRDLLLMSVQAVFYQVMVSGACNGTHDTQQRLARWLLTMHDRAEGDTFRLTHDFFAATLGVRRATISEALGHLEQAGAIALGRGRIDVADRKALHAASCECYDLVRQAHETLLPLHAE